ncbi:MAG: hypothetical protein D6800_07975, partial [Candidatus Zixiibacteriota bacterium]
MTQHHRNSLAMLTVAIAILLWAGLFLSQSARAQDNSIPQRNWCGTQTMYDAKMRTPNGGAASPQACTPLGPCDDPTTRDAFIPTASSEVKIVRLYFHVMRNDNGSNPAASEQDVADQVALM